jgi:hypothetical protein
LATEFAGGLRQRGRNPLWDQLHACLLRFGQRTTDTFCRLKQYRHQSQAGQNMSIKPPECYTTDSQACCLRVEIEAGCSLLLPFDQFVFANWSAKTRNKNCVSFLPHTKSRLPATRCGGSKQLPAEANTA